ncbi:hypothetical protein BH09PSE1_BH09PSE1_26830 [soil metagenome]
MIALQGPWGRLGERMSEVTIQTTAAGWAPAVLQRRKALVQRMGMGAATALIFTPILGWTVSTTWVVVYFAVQLIDAMIFAPITRDAVGRMPLWRMALGGAILFLNAASFGSLSLILWVTGGAMGGVCASIVLASGAIYAVVNSPRSMQVLVLTITPQFLYLLTTPVFMMMHGAAPSFVTACLIAIMVFGAYCISTWRSIDAAYVSESQARLAAESRRAEAEVALAGRAAFLAAIGHDLRTPIGAILTGSAEMDRVATDSAARAHAALITDAGLMMKALLDNLLDHSKLDAGRMTVEAEDFNLRSMLAQTMRLWTGPVRAKGLAFRIEGAHEMPAMARGDAMRLRQILNNLISNAMKFTDAGSVTLRLKSWAEEPSGHAVIIEVADTGPGMTAEQMERLFSPFDQTADGVSARHGGTGLGLAISRDLAQLMGGRLTARSVPGEGACFTLSLSLGAATHDVVVAAPLDIETRIDVSRDLAGQARAVARPVAAPVPAAAAVIPAPAPVTVAAPAEAVPPSAVEAALAALLEMAPDPVPEPAPVVDEVVMDEEADDRPLRVLVVDDHDINRRAVELILTPLGCDIASAADGMAALRLCEVKAFDVIFMDVRMPELDGRETTRRLRASGGINAAVPVIAVTADTSPDDVAACMDAGMTYFVSKPLTPPALLGALQHVLAGGPDEVEFETVAA